ncbi:MAG: beta-galactosidase [Anaerolineae bacterium]|nr:beta-galactosidase [Anaerolineae bacterium]
MNSFGIKNGRFHLNHHPFRILSGAMHYFRIRPEQWADRLHKLRLMGLNTVETYVAWNLHEPQPGNFRFDGDLDLVAYIEQAAALGLHVIVRPGPYICAEWDLGGLPAWLLRDPAMKLRCTYPGYLDAVDRFFANLLPRLAPLQITTGGPIIAMQIENEYGSYGNEQAYLRHLEVALRNNGIDCLLFTSDGHGGEALRTGTLPHIYKTVNFGSNAGTAFARLHAHQPDAPLMCMEFWNGWFDHWGETHHTRDNEEVTAVLTEMLAADASVNFYMFHGGTNFGFMNGANHQRDGRYEPTLTSYDYDAPLNEAGDITPKFLAYREAISQFAPVPDEPLPPPSRKAAYGAVALTEAVSLWDALPQLSQPVHRPTPEPMEMLGQNFGFILYRTRLDGPFAATLSIEKVHDRAHIFANGALLGLLERENPGQSLPLDVPADGLTLDILVENMGRVNYGPNLHDRKGITEAVLLDEQLHFGWEIFCLPLDDLAGVPFSTTAQPGAPAFYRGTFMVEEPLDTFVVLPGWGKGNCWINGFNLGRYWRRGPQQTLYVPAPLLKTGPNEIVLFEVDEVAERPSIQFVNQPILDSVIGGR